MELRRHFTSIDVTEATNLKGFLQGNSQKHIVEVTALRAKDIKIVLEHHQPLGAVEVVSGRKHSGESLHAFSGCLSSHVLEPAETVDVKTEDSRKPPTPVRNDQNEGPYTRLRARLQANCVTSRGLERPQRLALPE